MIVFFEEILILIFENIYLIIFERLYFSTYSYLVLIIYYGSIIVSLLIEQYMVWITFCFMEHIKDNRNIYYKISMIIIYLL